MGWHLGSDEVVLVCQRYLNDNYENTHGYQPKSQYNRATLFPIKASL